MFQGTSFRSSVAVVSTVAAVLVAASVATAEVRDDTGFPVSAQFCMHGNFAATDPAFANVGQCLKYVEHGGALAISNGSGDWGGTALVVEANGEVTAVKVTGPTTEGLLCATVTLTTVDDPPETATVHAVVNAGETAIIALPSGFFFYEVGPPAPYHGRFYQPFGGVVIFNNFGVGSDFSCI